MPTYCRLYMTYRTSCTLDTGLNPEEDGKTESHHPTVTAARHVHCSECYVLRLLSFFSPDNTNDPFLKKKNEYVATTLHLPCKRHNSSTAAMAIHRTQRQDRDLTVSLLTTRRH